jgi:hypothetical protein
MAAAICIGALRAQALSFPPITPDLGASLMLAALEFGLGVDSPHAQFRAGFDLAAEWMAAFVVAAVLLENVAIAVPRGSAFVREPLVTWRISIAIFGAIFSAWIVAAMSVSAGD